MDSLEHIVNKGETETTHNLETFPGGKGLNQSIALARAGAKVYHAGCIGDGGEMLVDVLKESGVDISYIRKVDEKNGHAVIQVSAKGENSIFLYPGSNNMVSKEFIDKVLDDFNKGDIILLQNEISNVKYIIEKAYEKKMCIILNPSPINEVIDEIDFNMISYIILNEVEAMEIAKCNDPKQSLVIMEKKYPDLKIMLTLGSKGCVYKDAENEVHQPAFKVNAVDTTAAGDTFTGYFVNGIANGDEYDEILKFASAASAIAVSRNGAAPSIPVAYEVLSSLSDMKENTLEDKNEYLSNQIYDYIMSEIKTANLKDLSKKLGYSDVYAGKLVKNIFKKTFSALVQEYRCIKAAELLLETEIPVEEIIKAVGYENESFFRKIFKEKYGKNPLKFRKMRSKKK